MEGFLAYGLLAFLGVITVFFLLILKAANRSAKDVATQAAKGEERHGETTDQLSKIDQGVQDVQGTLETKVLPHLQVAYRPISERIQIDAKYLIEIFKEAGIEAGEAREDSTSIFFGVEAEGFNVSFLVDYVKEADDLCFHSFAYSSDECNAELNQKLLELNTVLLGGSVGIRRFEERFVYMVDHLASNASLRLTPQYVHVAVGRVVAIHDHIKKLVAETLPQAKPILINEYIDLHNKNAERALKRLQDSSAESNTAQSGR